MCAARSNFWVAVAAQPWVAVLSEMMGQPPTLALHVSAELGAALPEAV